MSTEFSVNKKYLLCQIPQELEYQGGGDYLIIGTRFGNGEVKYTLGIKETGKRCVDFCGWLPKGVSEDTTAFNILFVPDYLICCLEKTDKPYYSQWSNDSPIYFYDTPCRWCWHTLDWGFWHKALPRKARVINDNGDNDIKTWGQLYDAIYGMDAHMQDKGEGGGTYRI